MKSWNIARIEIFSQTQYGFREKRGCILQLLTVFDTWSQYIDSDIPVDTIFLDFRKAFDSVPHKRLLLKLERQECLEMC